MVKYVVSEKIHYKFNVMLQTSLKNYNAVLAPH